MPAENLVENAINALRRKAMAVLADSSPEAIAACMSDFPTADVEQLRAPENGLVMVRGRVGGDGAPFNLGEATVTRAAVRLGSGEVGFAYVLGRDKRKATLIAVCDALIQSKDQVRVLDRVVAPLERAVRKRRQRTDAQTAATRVDFFTLVRGEG